VLKDIKILAVIVYLLVYNQLDEMVFSRDRV